MNFQNQFESYISLIQKRNIFQILYGHSDTERVHPCVTVH